MNTRQFDISRRSWLKQTAAVALIATGSSPRAIAATELTAKLFLTDAGTGENLMFLHGWTADSNDWIWQLPYFESKYQVIAVDLRGHGRSEIMPSGSYKPEDYVRDIESLITTRYPNQKFILVGHSMGGQIAARLAVKRPDLIKAVISIDGALGFSDKTGAAFANVAKNLQSADPGTVAAALFKQVYGPTTDPALQTWHARRAKGMDKIAVRESFGPLFIGPNQVGVGESSARFCKRLTLPFYHLCRDPTQADRMRPWFSNAKSKVDVWPDAGHWIMQDRKDDVNVAVASWIDAL